MPTVHEVIESEQFSGPEVEVESDREGSASSEHGHSVGYEAELPEEGQSDLGASTSPKYAGFVLGTMMSALEDAITSPDVRLVESSYPAQLCSEAEERRAFARLVSRFRELEDFHYVPGNDNEVRRALFDLANSNPRLLVAFLADFLGFGSSQVDEDILLEVIDTIPEVLPEYARRQATQDLLKVFRSESLAVKDSIISALSEPPLLSKTIVPVFKYLLHKTDSEFLKAQVKDALARTD